MGSKRNRKKNRKKNRKQKRKELTKMSKKNMQPMTDEEIAKLKEEHDKGGAFKQVSTVGQTCWDAGIEIKNGCSHMPKPTYHVYFETLAHDKIKTLQSHYPNLEWLAYLEGEVDHENSTVTVKDLVIPDSQQVTGVNVYNVEYTWGEGRAIIGVIHSHHGMGAFFSGTDDAYINQNHDVSIVVSTNKNSPIKGQVRKKAPCGAYVLAEDENVTFSVKYDSGLDVDEFKKEFTGKINQYTAPIVSFSGNYLGRYGIYGGNTGSGVNTYGGRGSANPARNVRPVPSHVPTGNDDPYDMAEEDIREELRKFYSEEEVNEFFQNGEAEEELIILKSLEDQGISVLGNYDNFDDDNSIWEDLGENLEEMTSGLPLADQEEDDGEDATVWDSEDETLGLFDENEETEDSEGSEDSEDDEELPKTGTGNTVH